MKTYKSKLGMGWLIPVAPFILIFMNSFNSEGWILLVLSALFLFLILHLIFTTKYVLDNETLNIKSGFLYNLTIDIKTIRKVLEAHNLVSAPAISIDRLEIFYNKFDSILISPKEKTAFIDRLLELNPDIEVKYRIANPNGKKTNN